MDAEEYRKKIERDILNLIEDRLKAGKMDANRAREIARFVLKTLKPHMTLGEIYRVVPRFENQFSELAQVVIPIINEYDMKVKQMIMDKVAVFLKNNKIDEAIKLAKKANSHEVDITK